MEGLTHPVVAGPARHQLEHHAQMPSVVVTSPSPMPGAVVTVTVSDVGNEVWVVNEDASLYRRTGTATLSLTIDKPLSSELINPFHPN